MEPEFLSDIETTVDAYRNDPQLLIAIAREWWQTAEKACRSIEAGIKQDGLDLAGRFRTHTRHLGWYLDLEVGRFETWPLMRFYQELGLRYSMIGGERREYRRTVTGYSPGSGWWEKTVVSGCQCTAGQRRCERCDEEHEFVKLHNRVRELMEIIMMQPAALAGLRQSQRNADIATARKLSPDQLRTRWQAVQRQLAKQANGGERVSRERAYQAVADELNLTKGMIKKSCLKWQQRAGRVG